MSISRAPVLVKGGLVLLRPGTWTVLRTITLQYNPDTITRTMQLQAVGEGDRLEALRMKGPPIETIKLEAEIDATDQLEHPGANTLATQLGIHPQLAALESIVHPASEHLVRVDAMAGAGVLEVAPAESPLTIFVWSATRTVPVRLTELTVTEEAFDPALNPIRAKVSLGMRVLSVNDIGFEHKGGSLFMAYLRSKERLAQQAAAATGMGGV